MLLESDLGQRLVVHNWGHQSQSASQELLDKGQVVVDAARRLEGWYTPRLRFDASIFMGRGRPFLYARDPPSHCQDQIRKRDSSQLESDKWGLEVGAGDHEVVLLEELDDFRCTDISWIFQNNSRTSGKEISGCDYSVASIVVPVDDTGNVLDSGKRISADLEDAEPSRKRRRVDGCSLHQIFPYKHYHASLVPPPSEAFVDLGPAIFFSKAAPKYILPYTLETTQEYLADSYARAVWIIPLRGVPPWEECTPASLLFPEGSHNLRPSAPKKTSLDSHPEITWTLDSVQAFWSFLLDLRSAHTLGPLALSFHAAPETDTNASASWKQTPAQRIGFASDLTSVSALSGTTPSTRNERVALRVVDHIKIYHDVAYTKYVRNVLHAWAYKFSDAPAEDNKVNTDLTERTTRPPTSRVRKIRIFKGARLVLVDDRNRAVLTC